MSQILLSFFDGSQAVVLLEPFGVQLNWGLSESFFFPLVWTQVARSFGNSLEGGLGEVTEGGGATFSGSVNIGISGVREDLLWNWSGNNTGTSWGRDESHMDGSTFGVYLAWNGVWFSKFGTPVASSDWNNRKLGQNNSRSDGVGDFFGTLDSESDVSGAISDDDGGLESVKIQKNEVKKSSSNLVQKSKDFFLVLLYLPSSLTGSGLFLNWLDFQDFVFQGRTQEVFNNFGFLDWEREGVNFSE